MFISRIWSHDTPFSIPRQALCPILLLLSSGFACLGCDLPQLEMSSPDSSISSRPQAPTRPIQQGPARFLPYPEIESWTLHNPATLFSIEELTEHVSGDVELFAHFGFIEGAVGEYRSSSHPTGRLRIEVHDFGSRLNAFGLLAAEIATLPDPSLAEAPGILEIRQAGLLSPGRLNFFRGRYYVRIVYQETSPRVSSQQQEEDSRELLPPLARTLALSLPGDSELPRELALLPKTKRVRRSEQFHSRHLLDLKSLGPGLSSLYGDPGPRFQVGITLDHDLSGARDMFKILSKSLTDSQPMEELGEEALHGVDTNGRRVFAVRQEGKLVVAIGPTGERQPPDSLIRYVLEAALVPNSDPRENSDPRPWVRR